jgi:hypothetical protein
MGAILRTRMQLWMQQSVDLENLVTRVIVRD